MCFKYIFCLLIIMIIFGKVSLHPITDGRDVAGDSSPKYFDWLQDKIKKVNECKRR